jgi:hypothetical protein
MILWTPPPVSPPLPPDADRTPPATGLGPYGQLHDIDLVPAHWARGPRELAHRANGGFEIVLLWDQATDELTVRVFDERSGARFDVAADPHEALEVFNHPFSYAPSRRTNEVAPLPVLAEESWE